MTQNRITLYALTRVPEWNETVEFNQHVYFGAFSYSNIQLKDLDNEDTDVSSLFRPLFI
jgi:hypothetical protein